MLNLRVDKVVIRHYPTDKNIVLESIDDYAVSVKYDGMERIVSTIPREQEERVSKIFKILYDWNLFHDDDINVNLAFLRKQVFILG